MRNPASTGRFTRSTSRARGGPEPGFFSYLRSATNIAVDYKLGDARLRLREAPQGHYGLIICDAFSSDVRRCT